MNFLLSQSCFLVTMYLVLLDSGLCSGLCTPWDATPSDLGPSPLVPRRRGRYERGELPSSRCCGLDAFLMIQWMLAI